MASIVSNNISVVPEAVNFNPNYAVHLYGTDENGTTVDILAAMPEQFGIHLTSDWHSLLNQASIGGLLSGSLTGTAAAAIGSVGSVLKSFVGQTDIAPALTHQVWTSTSPLNFSIPFQFNAISSARKDVMDNIEALLLLESPSLNSAHTLKVPGPTILKTKNKNASQYKMHLNIGTTYIFEDIIVTGVSSVIDAMFTKSGDVVSAQVDVSISTSRILTKTDINKIFGNTRTPTTLPSGSKSTPGNSSISL
jgi:hypothetical protein